MCLFIFFSLPSCYRVCARTFCGNNYPVPCPRTTSSIIQTYTSISEPSLVIIVDHYILGELLSCPLLYNLLQEVRSDQFGPPHTVRFSLRLLPLCSAPSRHVPIDPQVDPFTWTIIECTRSVQELQSLGEGKYSTSGACCFDCFF